MITEYEDYCSYEVAKLLKEKGFDGLCACCYKDGNLKTLWDNTFGEVEPQDWNNLSQEKYDHIGLSYWFGCISVPTHQMVKRWLLKKYNIFINVLFVEETNGFGYTIEDIAKKKYITSSGDSSYKEPEEADEAAIKYCLENII